MGCFPAASHEALKLSPRRARRRWRAVCRDLDKAAEAAEEKANYSGSAQVSGRISRGVREEMELSLTLREEAEGGIAQQAPAGLEAGQQRNP